MAIGINMNDEVVSDDVGSEESVDKKKGKGKAKEKVEKKSLKDRLKGNSTIKDSSILATSKFFNVKDMVSTPVPMINVALSGMLDGGFTPGLTVWAGKSKHFKTAFCLLMAKAYMDKYPDAMVLFYDSEFGSPKSYFESFNIDINRIIHTPLLNIEQLKFDIMQQLQDIYRGDKLFILVDSVGNLASKKEVDDALVGNSAADMTRAKQLKSLFRMVTPHLNLKDIPMVVVNHIYSSQGMYSTDVVSGGTGIYYSADNIYIVGRQQDKDGNEIVGYDFIINVEKSRYVKEKSKIPISVSYEEGIKKYSGLMEIALLTGHVDKPTNGWYCVVNKKTGECGPNKRLSETECSDFWEPILADESFKDAVKGYYMLSHGSLVKDIHKFEGVIDNGEGEGE